MAEITTIKTPFFQKVGGKTYKAWLETAGDQVKLVQQNGVENADAQAEFEALRTKTSDLENQITELSSIDAIKAPTLVNSDGDIPTTYSKGDSWRVATAGMYRGVECDISDLIVALVDRAGTGNDNGDFYVLQGNLIKAVTGPATATADNVAVFDGGTGRAIKDSGLSITSISESVSKSHEHTNKTDVLDKLSAEGDKLQFNGKAVGGVYGAYVTVDENDPGFNDAVTALGLADGAFFTVVKE